MTATQEQATATEGKTKRTWCIWDKDLDPAAPALLPHPINDFGGVGSEQEAYRLAPLVTKIATALIEESPNWLGHLRQFAICYLWAPTLGGSRGLLKWWEIVIPKKYLAWSLKRDEYADLVAAQALVTLSVAACREARLSWWEFEALVATILRCMEDNDDGGIRIRKMTDEIEAVITAQYGVWSPRLKRLMEAITDGPGYQARMDDALAAAKAEATEAKEAAAALRAKVAQALG